MLRPYKWIAPYSLRDWPREGALCALAVCALSDRVLAFRFERLLLSRLPFGRNRGKQRPASEGGPYRETAPQYCWRGSE